MKRIVGACSIALFVAAHAPAQTPAGAEFRVNTYTPDTQGLPRLAMEPNGDFIVVWMSNGQDGSDFGVFGQRYLVSGAPRGGEFPINSHTPLYQGFPAVTVGSKGDFVVVWDSRDQDGSYYGVFGQRFAASGARIGSEFIVNTYTTDSQYSAQVDRAADGRFVVVWTSVDGDATGVAGRRFDASGAAIGSDFLVNLHTTGFQRWADIAMAPDGSFVVVWEDYQRDGHLEGIFGQRFDAAANPVGADFQVNNTTAGAQFRPSLSRSPTGGFVVVWTSENVDGSDWAILARRFDASANPLGNEVLVNTYTTSRQYTVFDNVTHDASGNFVVSWGGETDGDFYGAFAQRFSASGARRGGEFQVNTYTTGSQGEATVVSDPVGNFVIAWGSYPQDAGTLGVYAQRFGGLAPAALAVDTAANNVLEPGETVSVRPSWRNFNGAAQTFGGTLSSITGPAGATYAITDGVGDYGTVANGATAPCADCYAVSVSNPPTRPVTHWDASAVESILPDTQGQQKQWLLHVGRSFTDVPASNGFYRFIETLLHRGVTSGCSATAYCPGASTTREQLAAFVLVAKEGAGYAPPACGATPVFADVPASSPFCRWIEELARRGVVSGCGGGNYCPTAVVTREQMTVFVLRILDPALNPPPCVPPNLYFDVPETSPFCRWIEELTVRNVVGGCGSGNFCPTAQLTREQMGVFMVVTFGLTLYGP